MDVFEYSDQVEALVFNYLSFGFFSTTIVNSFWTLIAVLTAAISFWSSIRAVGFIISLQYPHKSDDSILFINDQRTQILESHEEPPVEEEEEEEVVVEGVHVCSCSSSSFRSAAVIDVDGVVKGGDKFMVHYYDEDDDGVNYNDSTELTVTKSWRDHEDQGVLLRVREVVYDYSESNWERILQVRRSGDLGWYRYQDLTSLNGSVVKLWRRC